MTHEIEKGLSQREPAMHWDFRAHEGGRMADPAITRIGRQG